MTAYDRQAMLDKNINGLAGSVTVLDDHSIPPLESPHPIIYAPENHGKQRYWEWINVGLDALRGTTGDVLITTDDISIKSGGIEHAQMLLDSVRGYGPVCINLLWDRRVACWNKIKRSQYNRLLYRSGFVDGCFIMNRQVLELMDYEINPIYSSRWQHNPKLGSGVWQQWTDRCHKFGVRFFQDASRNFAHGTHESKMNYAIRKRQPL